MNKVKFRILVLTALCLLFTVSFLGCSNVENKSIVEDVEIAQLEEINEAENVFEEATSKDYEKPQITEKPQSQNNIEKPSPLPIKEKKQEKEVEQDTQSKNTQVENTQATDTLPPQGEPEADTNKQMTCTLYVNCKSVLQNYDKLKENKKTIVPANGIIYEKKRVNFSEGESVFDILKREMKNSKIQLEFVHTPMYNSVYIEGIGNLYEFDCGENSGWQYKVNGVKPNYGCSQYIVNDGDSIEFYYSCNFLDEN